MAPSSPSKDTKTKSPGVRIIHGRIYDSDNGKTCHQCGQKTMAFSATCKNYNEDKQCGTQFCQICLLNRYGENVEDAVALDCEWKCPICRGICNCSRCMKKRGCKPTGALSSKAKANGFPSVSHMLRLEDCRNIKTEEVDASLEKSVASNEEPVAASLKRGRTKTILDENHDTVYQSKHSKMRRDGKGSSSKMSTGRMAENDDNSEESKKENGAFKDTMDGDEQKVRQRKKRIPRNGKVSSSKVSTGRIPDNNDNNEESKKEYGAPKDIMDGDEQKVFQRKKGIPRNGKVSSSKVSTGRICDNTENNEESMKEYGAPKDTISTVSTGSIPDNTENNEDSKKEYGAPKDTISKVPTGSIPDNTENTEDSKKEYGALKGTIDCDEQKICKRIKGMPRKNKGSSSKMSTVKIADNSDNNQESTKEYGPLKDTIDCDEQKICKRTRRKSLGVRIKNGKVYDSENGKCCHQCRQKTTIFSLRCKNYKGNEQCTLYFCQVCLLNRYGENAEEIAKVDCPWKCPKCRGVCNCSFCMKKKGCKPTGILHHIAKANGFHSVSEMLASDIKRLDDSSPNGNSASNEDLNAASSKKGRKKTNLDGNHDAGYQSKPSKRRKNCEVPSMNMSPGKSSVATENSKKCKKEYNDHKDAMDCDKKKVRKPIKSTKSPVIRTISCRVYDSENRKTCHQCRQKTLIFTVTCKNYINSKQCALHFCQICLLNRYGEIAAEVSALGCRWKCPKCRGVCNCCSCMKKRGYKPTGILSPAAEAKGFPSVSEMLCLEDCKKVEVSEEASLARRSDTNEVSKSTFVGSDEMRVKVETMEESGADEGVESTQLYVTDNISTELVVAAKNDKEELIQELLTWPTIKNEAVEDVPMGAEKTTEFEINKEEIAPPQGNQLTKIANLELPAEDIGNALQFLEFCHTFGQVLGLRKEQPESLLQEIVSGQMSGGRCDFSCDYFHIKLLSIIQRDSGRGSSLEAAGRDSWIEAFGSYISDSEIMSKELMLDSERWGLDSYEKQSPSKKLRILTFLCDEALGTSELRNWIDQQNMKFVEEAKTIKVAKKKLQDEMAAEILQTTGKQLLMSEHDSLSLKMKAEVIQCLNDKLDEMKKGMRNAVRSDPLLSDKDGRKFWNLRSYSDVVTDACSGSCNEKWFGYNVQEKASVDKYIAGYHCRTADKSSSLLCPVEEN